MANQTNSIVPFLFEGEILTRVVMRDREPWFVAADLARLLGFRDASNAVRYLEDDEKGTLQQSTPGGVQEHLVVSESGLYLLIFRSRKPAARRFRQWVTSEVLPKIRKTGGYRMRPRASAAQIERQLRINEWKAATNALDSIRRAAGNRPAALAAPAIFAALGIRIDLDASDTLAQGELPLAETAETVH
jgi:prophage antirepressor-like protein